MRHSLHSMRRLRRAPKHTGAWTRAAARCRLSNRHADAVASFEKAIAVDKNFADARSNMALSLLTLGQLSRGFAEYEWRWKRTGMSDARRNYRGRPGLGEFPIGQRTILLAAEQGLGDSISSSATPRCSHAPAQRSCSKCSRN
jgi:hypothetical protein